MAYDHQNEHLLTSWKEIAVYLGVDRRTCYRWEQHLGLPVHRIEGELKPRVFAYAEELDRWKAMRAKDKTIFAAEFGARSKWYKATFLLGGLGTFILLVYLIFNFSLKPSGTSQPADFRITGSRLVVLNENGKKLWHFETGLENLLEEKDYRLHFQIKRKDGSDNYLHPYLMFRDIDGDENLEVLFSTQTQDNFNEGTLYCLNRKGMLLWKFKAGKLMKYGRQVYTSDYRIEGFSGCDINNDGQGEIVMYSTQRHFFPCQLVVLSSKGELLGEFWNAGHISDFDCADLNRDGKKEILAVGMNNEHEAGCLVVFDCSRVHGSSPQKANNFSCQSLEPGTEREYILFPRTDVDILESVNESMESLDVLKDDRIIVRAHMSKILYDFDYNLVLQEARNTHYFENKYRKAAAEGKIKSALTDEYFARLGRGLLYWNGRDWVNHPAVSAVF